MRILILNSEYPPIGAGAATACKHIAKNFTDLGHDVKIITSRTLYMPKKEIDGGVEIYRTGIPRLKKHASHPAEQFMFVPSAMLASERLIIDWLPDITLPFFGFPSGFVAKTLFQKHKIPYVISLRGGDVPGFRSEFSIYHRIGASSLREVWKNAKAIVANSTWLCRLAQRFEPNLQIQIVSNGVDSKTFGPHRRNIDVPTILVASRLVHQKGIDILLNSLLSLKNHKWKLRIVGAGKGENGFRQLIENFGLTDRTTFTGWVEKREMPNQYKVSDIFILPSRQEGMSNSLLEAMASALPVVAARVGGSDELIVNGVNGILFDTGDKTQLTKAIESILQDPSKGQHLGEEARETVVRKFTWRRVADEYIQILDNARKDS